MDHDIEVEAPFGSIDDLADAPFPVFIHEQVVGDYITVPPLAPHQVWNRSRCTIKAAWIRITVRTLEQASGHGFPAVNAEPSVSPRNGDPNEGSSSQPQRGGNSVGFGSKWPVSPTSSFARWGNRYRSMALEKWTWSEQRYLKMKTSVSATQITNRSKHRGRNLR